MNEIEYVVKNSDDVFINDNLIKLITDQINHNDYSHWSSNFNMNNFSEKECIIISLVIESMNFCFWGCYDWKYKRNENEYIGSDALFNLVYDLFNDKKLSTNPIQLINISKDEFLSLFTLNEILPDMIEERYNSFHETIKTILSFNNFFDKLYLIKSDIELEKFISNNFINFSDLSNYKGITVSFNKRSRLVVADLFKMCPTIRNNIKNISNIMGCADYSLPRYFNELGILEYSDKLKNIIDNEILIEHNSNYEIEIRACTLYILEKIKCSLIKKGISVCSIELDNIIWRLSRTNRKNKSHHTMSIYY